MSWVTPFQCVSPDRLQIRQGGGCLSVFGLPFFAAGILLTLTAIGVVPIQGGSGFARAIVAVLAIVFTVVGAALVFGRSWTTIDRAQQQIVRQWGLLIPMRERIVPLRGCSAVTLRFIEGDSDSADGFPIALKARAGPDLPLFSFTDYAQARAGAKAVADHLHIDLEDASTDHPVRLTAGEADRMLQERLRSAPLPSADAAPPAGARSRVSHDNGVLTIVVPARPLSKLGLVAIVVPFGIGVTVGPSLWEFFRRTNTPDPVAWFFLSFLGLFVLLPTMTLINAFVRSRRGATIVHVSRQGLHVRERGAWLTRTVTSVDASDVLDIDYSSRRGKGLTVKTRTGLCTFGKGLDGGEVRYLHVLIVRALLA